MPVARPTGQTNVSASLKLRLIELLIKELMGETTNKGPVIFEDPSEPNGINVIVVWEAWDGLSQGDRASMIREAYARYARDLEQSVHDIDPTKRPVTPMVPIVTRAIGVTRKEVDENGLLPCSIVPEAGLDELDPDEVETLLLEAGAIQGPRGIQLRLPNVRMAKGVYARLMEEMPEAHWKIVEEAGLAEDRPGS